MNLWKRFRDLLPKDPLLVGTVLTHNSDGTSTVQFPGGGQALVKGQTVAVGLAAYVQGGWIKGEAPDLVVSEFEV
jgi:hypothetical protein